MSDLDPDAIMRDHAGKSLLGGHYCLQRGCDEGPWPCLPYRLAAEVRALRPRGDDATIQAANPSAVPR